MPQVVNGCGTWYYGKNRVHRIPMTCPNCGAYADLESYDTTKYVVFLFVPLIPVSKWRVLEKCPACTQHRAIKLKDWEEAKQADSAAVTEELRQDPTNPETVQKVIGVATSYQDENLFLQVAEKLARPMTDHAEVQATLGSAYSYFSRRDQAEEAYKASLAVKDDPEVAEQLALQLLRQGSPEEAEKFLQHALNSDEARHAGFVHLLGEGYLADGQTERGLALLDQSTQMEPAIKADKQHQKLRKKAEKALGTGRGIPSSLLTASKKSGYEEGGIGGNVAALIGPLVAVILLAFYLSMAWSFGNAREVFVVNGLNLPYTATIGGTTIELPPHGRRTIEVPEGMMRVAAHNGDQPIAEDDVSISTSFFLRPFLSRTFVINPDRTALLAWEKQYYAENINNAPDGEYELYVGDALYEFKDIDYEFAPFPMQIKSSGSGSISKTRIAVMDEAEVTQNDLLFLLPELLGEEQYARYLMTRARFSPNNERWVFALQTVMSAEEYLVFLEAGLETRPLQVHWHRAYQSMVETHRPDQDLAAQYRGYLAADPDNAELLYLAGRATQDVDGSIELFRKAVEAEPPSAFAANALAFQLISEGRFEEASPLVDQAVASDPESLTFDSIDRTVKLATGQFDELIARVRERTDNSWGGLMLVSQVAELLGYKGDLQAAQEEIDRFTQQQTAEGDAEYAQTIKDALLTSLAYTAGDLEGFLQRHSDAAEPGFDVLYVRGDLEAAAEAIDDDLSSSDVAMARLAVFLKAHAEGNAELADQQLGLAIESLRQGTTEERIYAAALDGEGSRDSQELLRLAMMPEKKRVVLAALGVLEPQHRDEYFALARKLNFERTVPWAFLRDFLDKP